MDLSWKALIFSANQVLQDQAAFFEGEEAGATAGV